MTRLIDAVALCDAINKSMLVLEPREVSLLNEIITNATTIQCEGWVSVPIEPTEEMIEAVLKGTPYVDDNKQLMRDAYRAMIQAAPKE